LATVKINSCDKDWFNRDYVFYDGQGNPMNIIFDQQLGYYTGKMFFQENSSDTFKTLEINTFERIKGFEYQQYFQPNQQENLAEDELQLEKFQLFNTHGIELKGNRFSSVVRKIEAVNDSEEFFSKWIYGEGIDNFFEEGTEIKFNRDIFDITTQKVYTVIQTKRNAILIITNQNNFDFVSEVGGRVEDDSQYEDLIVSGTNLIKIKDYITEDFENKLPEWSEPNFYNKIFTGQKINLVNSEEGNTGIYSVKNKNLNDNDLFSHKIFIEDLNGDLTIKVINKTSNLSVYNGEVNLISDKKLVKLSRPVSDLFSQSRSFKLTNSKLNSKTLTSINIPVFNKTSPTKYFQEDQTTPPSQVLYEGEIYHCIKTYKQTANSTITPKNTEFWVKSDFLKVNEDIEDEVIINSNLFLLTNEIQLDYLIDPNLTKRENLSKAIEDFKPTLSSLKLNAKIDPLDSFGVIENKYPTDYIDVEFFIHKTDRFTGNQTNGTNFSPTGYKFTYDPHQDTSITLRVDGLEVPVSQDRFSSNSYAYFSDDGVNSVKFDKLSKSSEIYWKGINSNFEIKQTSIVELDYLTEVSFKERKLEKVIEVEEPLIEEKPKELSQRNQQRVVIEDIDEFGLIVKINGEVFEIDSTIIFDQNGDLDLEESIDKTLKTWFNLHKFNLERKGILPSIDNFSQGVLSTLNNSIVLETRYPNIPLEVEVEVGDTADFFIPSKLIVLNKIGDKNSLFSIEINKRVFSCPVENTIDKTIESWIQKNDFLLNELGIIAEKRTKSIFLKRKQKNKIDLGKIYTGKTFTQGEKVFEVINFTKGNEGLILSSNQIRQKNKDINFEEECFSTGQIISINNSDNVLNNQEYNIIFLDPTRIILSYQGPFFGSLEDDPQNAFFNLSFGEDYQVGDTITSPSDQGNVTGEIIEKSGDFYSVLSGNSIIKIQRDNAFGFDPDQENNIQIENEDKFRTDQLSIDSLPIDIDLLNLNDQIYILSENNLNIVDGNTFKIKKRLSLNGDPIKQIINPVNGLLYILTSQSLIVVNPLLGGISQEIDTLGTGWDIAIDTITGSSYISHTDSDRILKVTKNFSTTSEDYLPGYFFGELTFNRDDRKIYVFTRKNRDINIDSDKKLYRIDTNRDSERDTSFFIETPKTDSIGLVSRLNGSPLNENKKIHYNPFNGSLYLNDNGELKMIDKDNNQLNSLQIELGSFYSVAMDSFIKCFWVLSEDGKLHKINENNFVETFNISTFGVLMYNPVDSNLYISQQQGGELHIFSTLKNEIFETIDTFDESDKIIFNRGNKSIIGLSSNENLVTQLNIDSVLQQYKSFSNILVSSETSYNQRQVESSIVEPETQLGGLNEQISEDFIYLKTREFIRRPRKNYSNSGSPKAQWIVELENSETENIFIFDISGDHIQKGLQYTGEKPLPNPRLKSTPNLDSDKVNDSNSQQTIFDRLSFELDYNDSEENVSFIPEGLQVFLGYNSKEEGVDEKDFYITENQDISVKFESYDSFQSEKFPVTLPEQFLSFSHNTETKNGEITLNENSSDTFLSTINKETLEKTNTNLKEGQIIQINIENNSEDPNLVSNNDGITGKILKIFKKKLVIEYTSDLIFTKQSTKISRTNTESNIYLNTKIKVLDKIICEINIKGQTEIEDPRYRTELSNTGKLINPKDVFIFREYDVKEGGVDYTFINQKRKEMIHVRNEIFNYLGAYKSIINAINLFGYNDLQLNEYFQNINPESENFRKLTAVEIPDIFDNSVEGWTENYKFWDFPNENFQETKLFNLFYKLTDFHGNKLSTFSLDEVIIKLRGLKRWLENNIVPVTHQILDITGRADFKDELQIYNTPSMVKNISIKDEISPVEFFIDESYLMPIESGSNVFTTKVEFSVGEEKLKPDFFELNIRTYRTHPQWDPFESYKLGDRVKFDGKIFENVFVDPTLETLQVDSSESINKNNNPNFYEDLENWQFENSYQRGDIVRYDRDVYLFTFTERDANYLPFLGFEGDCAVGTPSQTNSTFDNFFGDLSDIIFQSQTRPSYFSLVEERLLIDFDIIDTIKEEIPDKWCDIIERDEVVIEQLATILINQPEENYQGEKPANLEEAKFEIRRFIEDFESIKSNYKFKFIDLDPEENSNLENEDFVLWEKITKWKEVNLLPVQKINEYRSGEDMMLPFNFTIDSSLDPFVVVSCKSSNGYGQVKNIEKSFEITFDQDDGEILNTTLRYQEPSERFSSITSNFIN